MNAVYNISDESVAGLLRNGQIDIIKALLESDKIIVQQVLFNRKLTPFIISDDTLDFILKVNEETGGYDVISFLLYGFGLWGQYEQMIRMLPLMTDKENILSILGQIIQTYAASYNVDPFSNLRKAFLMLSDYLQDKLTLEDVSGVYRELYHANYLYVQYDCLLYLIFKVINNEMLKSTPSDIIEEFAIMSIRNKASYILTQTLLKYVNNSEQFEINVINQQGFQDKPPDYISLFAEDV